MAKPKPIGNIVAELLARRGYGRLQAADAWAGAWQEAAGPTLAGQSRAGQVRRGVLEVWVTNSTLVQELSFEKARLLKTLTRLVPEEKIRDLKFRVGPIDWDCARKRISPLLVSRQGDQQRKFSSFKKA